jgi:hypothetical protein
MCISYSRLTGWNCDPVVWKESSRNSNAVCIPRHCYHLHTTFSAVMRNCDVIYKEVLKKLQDASAVFSQYMCPYQNIIIKFLLSQLQTARGIWIAKAEIRCLYGLQTVHFQITDIKHCWQTRMTQQNWINIIQGDTFICTLSTADMSQAKSARTSPDMWVLRSEINKCSYLLTYLLTYVLTSLLPYLPTPWSKVLLEKLTGLHLVRKFPAFYGTRRFITAITSARHLSLSWAVSKYQSRSEALSVNIS